MATIFVPGLAGGLRTATAIPTPVVRLADPLARTLLVQLHDVIDDELMAGQRDGEVFWARHVTQSRRDPALRLVHEGLERVAAWATLHRCTVTWRYVAETADRWCDLCLRDLATGTLELVPDAAEPAWTLRACSSCRVQVEAAPEALGAVDVHAVTAGRPHC